MIPTPKQIILEANAAPVLVGQWTVGEVRQAAEFLARWVDAQLIQTPPAPEPQPTP